MADPEKQPEDLKAAKEKKIIGMGFGSFLFSSKIGLESGGTTRLAWGLGLMLA